jgi:predicted DNA binding protein
MPHIVTANCETGQVLKRLMTPEEQELHDSMRADGEQFIQIAAEEAAAKASALAKLQALGLTEEEVKALLG